jgi:hypothetical protein
LAVIKTLYNKPEEAVTHDIPEIEDDGEDYDEQSGDKGSIEETPESSSKAA